MASAGIGADVEGFHAVVAAAAAGRVIELTIASSRLRDDRYVDLAAVVSRGGGTVSEVHDVREHAVTGAPQGVLARCRPIGPVSLDEAMRATDPAAIVVLDHIEDPRNVGAIARSAVAAGIGAMVVSADRSAPLEATAFKAAAGALETLPVVVANSVADVVRRLEDSDVWTVGLDGDGERSILGLELFDAPIALVIGAEGTGLTRLVRERVSLLARVPMAGDNESLNASVAAALAMFEVARVRGRLS